MKLIWKPLSFEHVEMIHKAISGSVAEYFYNFKNEEETRAWVSAAITEHEKGTKEEYVVFDDKEFIGMVSPRFLSAHEVDIGIWIASDKQGKGYGVKVLSELFASLRSRGVEKIIYETDADNIASIRLARSLGFIQEEISDGIRFTKYLESE